MKRLLFISSLFVFLTSCGGGGTTQPSSVNGGPVLKEKESADITNNPVYQKGLALIAKNDCLTCHSVEDKIQGPAYRDVANKYAGMPDTIVEHLANKVIKGGMGVWGDEPMVAHPNLSKEDAEAIVRYILLLKK